MGDLGQFTLQQLATELVSTQVDLIVATFTPCALAAKQATTTIPIVMVAVAEPAHSLIYARMRAALDGLDQGEFTEGHELPGKWKTAQQMIGRRLTQTEAKRLLTKF